MKFSPFLALYRIAWEPALLFVRALALLEKAAGGKLWPARWRLGERLGSSNPQVTQDSSPNVWMHAASLGESKGLWAVAQDLSANQPALRFLLTATTVEGLHFLADRISATGSPGLGARFEARLAPLDHPRIVRNFLRRHEIRALVLFEIELWPHFIRETRRAGRPVLWISARMPRRFPPHALRVLLSQIRWTQSQTGPEGVDLRGLHYLRERASRASSATAPPPRRAGIAFVSLHAEELTAIAPALESLRGNYPLFVFPRKMDQLPAFRAALEPLGFELRSGNPPAARQIVDAFGLVAETLARCRSAVMGGSFAPHGGHNLWEPLVAGVNMVIGPWHESQRYLVDKLSAAGLLSVVTSLPDLEALHERPDGEEGAQAAWLRFVQAEKTLLEAQLVTLSAIFTRYAAEMAVD